jgi:hypothetical protein
MSSRKSPLSVAERALMLAEDGLVGLPTSPHMRDLHRRVAALKSILHGVVRDVLTQEQHRRIAEDAVALASEVLDCLPDRRAG